MIRHRQLSSSTAPTSAIFSSQCCGDRSASYHRSRFCSPIRSPTTSHSDSMRRKGKRRQAHLEQERLRRRSVERGTHNELTERGWMYAELHKKQLLEEELAAS